MVDVIVVLVAVVSHNNHGPYVQSPYVRLWETFYYFLTIVLEIGRPRADGPKFQMRKLRPREVG